MSHLGFSNEPFRIFAAVVFFFKQLRFSSFYLSLSASITFFPSTFLYLHLFYGFFLAASITSLPSTFLYLHLFYVFFLAVRASEERKSEWVI